MAYPKVTEVIQRFGLLASAGHAKHFSQNFLCNLDITRKIVRLSGDVKGHAVLEIGPGPGGLSQSILEAGPSHFVMIEKDETCVLALSSIFGDQVQLIKDDFLKVDLETLAPTPIKVIANLPYSVSSPILLKLIKNKEHIKDMTLMFQKEFAKRLVAAPGSKTYGRLSVITQIFFEAKIVYTLPPSVFIPPPKVESCVVFFKPWESHEEVDLEALEKVTHLLFSQRRKMLRSILKKDIDTDIDLTKRPEDLTPSDFIKLTRCLNSEISHVYCT